MIATPSDCLPQERFTKKDPGSRLYRVSWLFLTGVVTSISCAFSASSSLLQILRNSSRHHSVLMLLSLSSVTNLSLLFGFCAACTLLYRCLQMEWWAAVTVAAIPSQPALLMWPCVSSARPSVLSPRASRTILHSRHPADCIFLSQPQHWYTDLDPTFLYISTLGTCSRFVRKNNMLALGVCLTQPCPNAGRRFAAWRSRLNHNWIIDAFPQRRTRWNTL